MNEKKINSRECVRCIQTNLCVCVCHVCLMVYRVNKKSCIQSISQLDNKYLTHAHTHTHKLVIFGSQSSSIWKPSTCCVVVEVGKRDEIGEMQQDESKKKKKKNEEEKQEDGDEDEEKKERKKKKLGVLEANS